MKRLLIFGFGIVVLLFLAPFVFHAGVGIYCDARLRNFEPAGENASKRLPSGGSIEFHGTKMLDTRATPPDLYVWDVRFMPPGGGAAEYVGSWTASKPTAGVSVDGSRMMVIAEMNDDLNPRYVYIRNKAGRWRQVNLSVLDLRDGFDPPVLASEVTGISVEDLQRITRELDLPERQMPPSCYVHSFLANRGEVRLSCTANKTGGEILLRLSEDGERLELLETKKYVFKD